MSTLPDDVRVPLDELDADAGYIIGRAIAEGEAFRELGVRAIRRRCEAIRAALATQETSVDGEPA